jgi:methylated-DNA-[protein]-cysteine S-methyltransferase
VAATDERGLRWLEFEDGRRHDRLPRAGWVHEPGALVEVERQLDAYFAGERRVFDLEIAPEGTPFQLTVWRALVEVPYGETTSYGELARRIGHPSAVRAVGLANGANPISIVIPCHRVVGAGGALTGYGGGLPVKRALLDLERGQRVLLPR